jgi:hypothetical protein
MPRKIGIPGWQKKAMATTVRHDLESHGRNSGTGKKAGSPL